MVKQSTRTPIFLTSFSYLFQLNPAAFCTMRSITRRTQYPSSIMDSIMGPFSWVHVFLCFSNRCFMVCLNALCNFIFAGISHTSITISNYFNVQHTDVLNNTSTWSNRPVPSNWQRRIYWVRNPFPVPKSGRSNILTTNETVYLAAQASLRRPFGTVFT